MLALSTTFHDQINSAQSLWKSGYNERWQGLDFETIKGTMGAFMDLPAEYDELPLEILEDLPDTFDARKAWPNCESIREIRDQSICGSCWAFGAVEAMSDRYCIRSGKQIRISAEDVLACCSNCGYGCNGGYTLYAWQYFRDKGIVTGGAYGDNSWCQPYAFAPCDHHIEGQYGPCGPKQGTPSCKYQCQPTYPKTFSQDKLYGVSAYKVASNELAIMTEIYKNGPVEANFNVFEDFLTYRSGIYRYVSGSKTGGHAVKILGWGVENGVKYWLCANSWNSGWGENGYFRIVRGENHVGIEEVVVAGIPEV